MITLFARGIDPLFRRLFPDIPPRHPASGSIVMNFSANMLGLDNAATPLGLKAMRELQEINPDKDVASNPMIMFLVLNTAGITLIPTSVIAIRQSLAVDQAHHAGLGTFPVGTAVSLGLESSQVRLLAA